MIVTNSTIDHNTSTGTAGGLYNAQAGVAASTMQLTNTTISANSAYTGGGFYNQTSLSGYASIMMTNVTLKDNIAAGGCLWNGSDANNLVYLKNTILADNGQGNCLGKAITSAWYSLSTDLSCVWSGVGNLVSTPAKLYPLQNNGGSTRTHLPAPSSPAVDVLSTDYPGTDQRLMARPYNLLADLGAVEREASDPLFPPVGYLPLIVR